VGLDGLKLVGREPSRSEQDPVGDRDLADVMQGSGSFKHVEALAIKSEVLSDGAREPPEALRVMVGVLVAVLGGHASRSRSSRRLSLRRWLGDALLELGVDVIQSSVGALQRAGHRVAGGRQARGLGAAVDSDARLQVAGGKLVGRFGHCCHRVRDVTSDVGGRAGQRVPHQPDRHSVCGTPGAGRGLCASVARLAALVGLEAGDRGLQGVHAAFALGGDRSGAAAGAAADLSEQRRGVALDVGVAQRADELDQRHVVGVVMGVARSRAVAASKRPAAWS
jgi:hypothetical protein